MMGLFDRLTERVEARAEARVRQVRERVGAAFGGIAGARIGIEGEDVVVESRGLVRRWLEDGRLRLAAWSGS
jgi:hypothetical protein